MVKKTFVIEGKLENLEAVIQQLIEQNGGVIVSVKNSKIQWTYIYGRQNLQCETIIRKNSITTEVHNLDGVSYGEGFVVNKFFKLLSEKMAIHKKEILKENKIKNIDSEYKFSDNQKSWSLSPLEKTVLISVAIILFCIYTFNGKDSMSKSLATFDSNSGYITKSGYKASYSEESMKMLVRCSVSKDYQCIDNLLYSGEVFELPAGQDVYVVKSGLSGKVKIRLKGDTQEIWTFLEAIKSY